MDNINAHIRDYYGTLFDNKRDLHLPIKTGKDLAISLAYPDDLVHFVPEGYWVNFHPCDNPLPFLTYHPDDLILNLGCGIGIDSVALALKCPSPIKVISLDVVFTALKMGITLASHLKREESSLEWVCGDAEKLPFQSERFDCVFMNGVFNLFPKKKELLEEIKRTMKPSGSLVIADLCCDRRLPEYFHENKDAWAWCLSGASTEEAILNLLKRLDFESITSFGRERDMFYSAVFYARKRIND